MRTRTMGGFEDHPNSGWTASFRDFDGNESEQEEYFSIPVGKKKTFTDQVTPRFRERSANGEVIVNAMHSLEEERTATPGSWDYYVDPPPDKSFSWLGQRPSSFYHLLRAFPGLASGGVSHRPLEHKDIGTLAATEAAANVAAPDFDGLVTLGELAETISFLSNPLKGYNRLLEEWRKRKNRSRFRKNMILKDYVADQWLSLRYGVRPLYYDTVRLMEAIDESRNSQPERFTARGFASEHLFSSDVKETESGGNSLWRSDHDTSSYASARAGILYEISVDYDHFGFRPSEVPGAAWELIPFSFVVDWFANIGNYVNAIVPRMGVRVLGSWTTVKVVRHSQRSTRCIIEGDTGWGDPRHMTGNSPTFETYYSVETTRTPGTKTALRLEPGVFSGDIGKGRIVDLVTIANQLWNSR